MRHWSLMDLTAAAILLAACQPPLSAEPTGEAPPVDTAEPATPTNEPPTPTSVPPSATPSPVVTLTASSDLLPELSQERYFTMVEGCDFLPPEVGESLVGPLMQSAWMEQVYSDFDTRFIVRCLYLGEEKYLLVYVWIAPTLDEAQADYNAALGDAAEEAVTVDGLGEAAFWWPRALWLDVLHKNARLEISFSRLLDESRDDAPAETANSAAMLAAAALPLIDPSLDPIDPPTVDVPADAPIAEIVTIEQVWVDGTFEACSLLTTDEFEALIGPLSEPPQSGMSVGEMVGNFYDCYTSASSASASYSLYFADSPGAAIDRFLSAIRGADRTLTPLEDVGDDAAISADGYMYTISVLRGTVVGYFTIGMEDTPENRVRSVEFAKLVMDRLFERAEQAGGS